MVDVARPHCCLKSYSIPRAQTLELTATRHSKRLARVVA
jgi:hypothetical protein